MIVTAKNNFVYLTSNNNVSDLSTIFHISDLKILHIQRFCEFVGIDLSKSWKTFEKYLLKNRGCFRKKVQKCDN